jgi:hypothetical protein
VVIHGSLAIKIEEKVSPFQLGLHHFNPPLKEISYKRDNEVFHKRSKRLGLNNVFKISRIKGCRLNVK